MTDDQIRNLTEKMSWIFAELQMIREEMQRRPGEPASTLEPGDKLISDMDWTLLSVRTRNVLRHAMTNTRQNSLLLTRRSELTAETLFSRGYRQCGHATIKELVNWAEYDKRRDQDQ